MRRSLVLFAAVCVGFAPLPFPRPVDSQKLDEFARSAKDAEESARKALRDAVHAGGSTEAWDEANRRYRADMERSAREFARLAVLLESLSRPRPADRARAYEANLGAGRTRFSLQRHQEALAFFGTAADRSPDPKARVVALGRAIQCHAALGDKESIRRTLALIGKEIPRLAGDDRLEWERWLAEAGKP